MIKAVFINEYWYIIKLSHKEADWMDGGTWLD